jgi:hypothetical protein
MKRARDLSRRQLVAAAKRQGFRAVMGWLEDTSGETPGVSYGMVMTAKGKVLRRTSLAHAIRQRKAHVARAEA